MAIQADIVTDMW